MLKNATENIKTFSVGFSGNKHNELPHAKKIAKYLGTDHHELMIDDFTLLDSFSKMGQIYDEPLLIHHKCLLILFQKWQRSM